MPRRTIRVTITVTYDTETKKDNGISNFVDDIKSGVLQRDLKKEEGIIKASATVEDLTKSKTREQ